MRAFSGTLHVQGTRESLGESPIGRPAPPYDEPGTYDRALADYIVQVEDELQHVSGPERIRALILGIVIVGVGALLALLRRFVGPPVDAMLPSTESIVLLF